MIRRSQSRRPFQSECTGIDIALGKDFIEKAPPFCDNLAGRLDTGFRREQLVDEVPERFAECRIERFDVDSHVVILGGAKCQACILHGEC